jgi:hypothetical protein
VSRRRVAARKTGLGVEIGFIYCRLRWSTGESAPGIDAVISGRGFLPLLLPPLPAVAREEEEEEEEEEAERGNHQIALALISLSETSETGSCHPLVVLSAFGPPN